MLQGVILTGIISWGCYLPKYRIKVENISKVQGKSAEQIKKSLLIKEKTVPGIDEDTVTMTVEAARNSLIINPKDIGAIYIGSESHPYAITTISI